MQPTLFIRTTYVHLRDTILWATQLCNPVQTNLISSLQQALQSHQVDFTQEYFWAIFGMLAGGRERGGSEERVEEISSNTVQWKLNRQHLPKN